MVPELELVRFTQYWKRVRYNAHTKHRMKPFYTVRLSVIWDRTDKIGRSVQSKETRAKKTPDGRDPEQSKVKFMRCKPVKWTTVILLGEYSRSRSNPESTIIYCREKLNTPQYPYFFNFIEFVGWRLLFGFILHWPKRAERELMHVAGVNTNVEMRP
jgi:hypothetical protein